jgi:poly(A) polymerase
MLLTPARYDQTAGEWRPADEVAPVRAERLTCATFNVWFDDLAFERRAEALLELLAGCDADVIALQEVTPRLLERILAADWVQGPPTLSPTTAGRRCGPTACCYSPAGRRSGSSSTRCRAR